MLYPKSCVQKEITGLPDGFSVYIVDHFFLKVVAEKSHFYFIPIPKYYKTPFLGHVSQLSGISNSNIALGIVFTFLVVKCL